MISIGYGDKFEVSEADYMYRYDITDIQMDKIKSFADRKGFFKHGGYKYYFDDKPSEVLETKEYNYEIVFPHVEGINKKTKFIVTDIIEEDNIPSPGTFTLNIRVMDRVMPLATFLDKANISKQYFNAFSSKAKTLKMNGVSVELIRVIKHAYNYTNIKKNKKYYNRSKSTIVTICKVNNEALELLNNNHKEIEVNGYIIERSKK